MDQITQYQWDEAKRESNLRKHGVDFALIEQFDWQSVLTREDTRLRYDERRFVSVGLVFDRLFVAVWTQRGAQRRLISLRKANSREERLYNDQGNDQGNDKE